MTDNAPSKPLPRILCVDDEENILKAIQRSLRKKFEIHTAVSGREGLEVLAQDGPFQVVVSDMKMPGMNGATFLSHVRKASPQTVRLLLTGFAEFDTVVAAINQGHIFRFLAKPCSAGDLLQAIEAGVAQYRLQTAEQVLLEQTLKGSITALTEVLSLASPEAFGRAQRISTLVTALAPRLGLQDAWWTEMAAMMSQIGTITLPNETALRLYHGSDLSDREKTMIARIPQVNRQVLENVPRLDPILEIYDWLDKNFDGSGEPKSKIRGEDIPLGARILRVALRVEQLQSLGFAPSRIMDDMRAQEGVYDPQIIEMVGSVVDDAGNDAGVRGVTAIELRTGMVLKEEVRASNGLLLVAGGQEVTVSLLERIHNYNDTVGLKLPMWVEVPPELAPDQAPPEKVVAPETEFNFS